MYRNTYITIDSNIIKNNIKNIINKYKYDYYIGVVKGYCYGHGIESIKYMIDAGINYLAVSNLDEAIEIRNMYKDIPILCLEPISLEYIDKIIENNITITINDINYYSELKNISGIDKIWAHIKINSGMNRLGIKDKHEVKKIIDDNIVNIEGIYTHFATRGYTDKFYDIQLSNFKDIVSIIDLNKIKIVHGFRSLTIVCHDKDDIFNGCRIGIMMYGINPLHKLDNSFKNRLRLIKYNHIIKRDKISKSYIESDLDINESLSYYTEVIQINKINKGEFVEYGAEYIADKDCLVATLDVGYADGFKRANKNGFVFINNKRYKIIGDIGMGMLSVLVDDSVKVHDRVELIGKNIKVNEVAQRCNTTTYEIYTTIPKHIKRVIIDE